MASATTERMSEEGNRNLPLSSTKDLSNQVCARCGGLLVRHICIDLWNSGSELDIPVLRCVQCGDVVDSVILRNRGLRQQLSTVHPTGTSASLTEIQVAP